MINFVVIKEETLKEIVIQQQGAEVEAVTHVP